MLMGGGLHATPQPIGCGGSVRRHDGPRLAARLPKMEVLSRAPSTSNQHRVEPYRATEESPTFARPPLRASMVLHAYFTHYHVLMGIARAALRPEKLTSSSSAAT